MKTIIDTKKNLFAEMRKEFVKMGSGFAYDRKYTSETFVKKMFAEALDLKFKEFLKIDFYGDNKKRVIETKKMRSEIDESINFLMKARTIFFTLEIDAI